MLQLLNLKRTTKITLFCCAFLVGLVLATIYWQGSLPVAGIATAMAWFCRRKPYVSILLVVIALNMGLLRGQAAQQSLLVFDQSYGRKVTLTGQITDDPALSDKGFLTFTIGNLEMEGRPVPGQVQITYRYIKLQRGYNVRIQSKLEPTLGSKQGRMAFGTLTVESAEVGWLERLRQTFIAGLRTALPGEVASFALGILIGARGFLAKPLQEQLTVVGLSHLVAVSGYNLTIIVAALTGLRSRSKHLTNLGALWLIAGFVVVAGASASIVRAALVSILLIACRSYGRPVRPVLVLAIAAALTAAYNPGYLIRDLGWQLSFLAFFGITVLAPAFEARWVKRPRVFKRLIIESLSAQLMTFPLLAMVFGRTSLVAPLANAIAMPLVPIIMTLSFIAALAGVFVPLFSGWLAWPASLAIAWLLQLVRYLASLGWAQTGLVVSSGTAVALYTIVAAWVTALHRRVAVRSLPD